MSIEVLITIVIGFFGIVTTILITFNVFQLWNVRSMKKRIKRIEIRNSFVNMFSLFTNERIFTESYNRADMFNSICKLLIIEHEAFQSEEYYPKITLFLTYIKYNILSAFHDLNVIKDNKVLSDFTKEWISIVSVGSRLYLNKILKKYSDPEVTFVTSELLKVFDSIQDKQKNKT